MKYSEDIFLWIQYIEDHLIDRLTTDEIAKEMGYSTYHFSRIFKEKMGVSLMEYVKDRRLLRATEDIVLGEKILDVAIKYGYETNNGFTKAFRKKYGFSPAVIKAFCVKKMCSENGEGYYMDKDKIYENANMFLKATENYKKPEELYSCLVKTIQDNKLFTDFTKLEQAYSLACLAHGGQKRKCGDDFVTHPINVAIILSEMEVDEDTIIAGLLHDVIEEGTSVTLKEVEEKFSLTIAKIIDNVTIYNNEGLAVKYEEKFDDRAVLVKLADRLHNMRTIEFIDPKKWADKSKQTIEEFTPIAAKLNSQKVRAELNALAVKYI